MSVNPGKPWYHRLNIILFIQLHARPPAIVLPHLQQTSKHGNNGGTSRYTEAATRTSEAGGS